MNHRLFTLAVLATVAITDSAMSQGGRRGPPQIIKERWGHYFTTEELPDKASLSQGQDLLSASSHVKEASGAGELAAFYLFDSTAKKLRPFEKLAFGNSKLRVGLRLFHCGRVDLNTNADAKSEYGKSAPLFVFFNKKGEEAARISCKGHKFSGPKVISAMRKATAGYAKVSFNNWLKKYGKHLNALRQIDSRQKLAEAKRARLEKNPKGKAKQLRDIEAALTKLADESERLLDAEGKLLETAKVPERDPKAVLIEQERGR